jgi:hypothetical protein
VDRHHIGLRLRATPTTPAELALGLHKRVSGKSFDKTKFALGILTLPADWNVPTYIKDGLRWLDSVVSLELPLPLPEATEPAAAAAAAEAAPAQVVV